MYDNVRKPESDWYEAGYTAPRTDAAGTGCYDSYWSPSQAAAPKKKSHQGLKITMIILGVLGSLVLSGFGTALSGYTRVREAGASYMQAELALIRLWKELAGAADFPEAPFKDSPSVTFTRADGTQTTINCEEAGGRLLIDGQVLLSDVASNGAGPSSIGIVLTRQLAGRQATWTLSVAPRNTPPAKE